MRTLWIALALAFGAPAMAGEYYVEGPEQTNRAAATEMSGAAEGDGRRVRVVRRFSDGAGWRYVLRVEGFEDEVSATEAARGLADGIEAAVQVFVIDGKSATPVAEIAPNTAAPAGAADEPAAAEPSSDEPSSDEPGSDEPGEEPDWLAQAVDAHGVVPGTLTSFVQGPTLFEYRRTLPDGVVLDHTWATQDGALYVELEVVEGSAKASRTVVIGDKAWLSVEGGDWSEQHAEKTKMTVDTLGPGAVLPFVLALGSAVEDRRELERMESAGAGAVDGVETRVLKFAGDRTSGPITLELGTDDHLIRRVHFGEGDVEHRFGAIEKLQGRHLPTRVETRRAGEEGVDLVEITTLESGAKVPADWFEPKG